jgi:hypothetical protein
VAIGARTTSAFLLIIYYDKRSAADYRVAHAIFGRCRQTRMAAMQHQRLG